MSKPLPISRVSAPRLGPGLLAVREPLSARASLVAGILAFAIPFALWCLVSYVPFLWHPLVLVRSGQSRDQLAFVRLARHHRRAQRRRRVHAKIALLFQRAVAGVAALLEHGLDVAQIIHRRFAGDRQKHGRGRRQRGCLSDLTL